MGDARSRDTPPTPPRVSSALPPFPPVTLVAVDEPVLAALVAAATGDADPDEVTPRSGTAVGWTAERLAWLAAYHRDRRAGLAGPAGELTRAVVLKGVVVGGVRLARTPADGVLETGIWLTRAVRGRGVGRAAVHAALDLAADCGARRVLAVTTAGNAAARAVLSAAGFRATRADDTVTAVVELTGPSRDR